VRSLDEALIGLAGGADLIDLKEPSRGALGTLDHAAVRICVRAISARRPVSATIGDLPAMDPQSVTSAVERMAATGVDFIKIGFFLHPRALDCAAALVEQARHARLVAVMFADEPYDLALLGALARAGFAGAMLDTARKTGKSLRDLRNVHELREFVNCTRTYGLLAGLAGSLHKEDIAPLLAMEPDYLGFRGALCSGASRTNAIDAQAFAGIRGAIPETQSSGPNQTRPVVRPLQRFG
jgi:dihydroneopterin aldolase